MYKNFVNPIRELSDTGKLGGVLLIICTLISLMCANTIIGESYIAFWNKIISIGFLQHSITHWINDGLMAIFFLLVGLEIKRELLIGELSDIKKSLLPVMAAVGGMVVPAVVFIIFNYKKETIKGWAIPTATDIAFSLGILSFLGNKIPFVLKVFLTALAIIDDLGAIIIIAVFYTNTLAVDYLLYAAITILILFLMNRFKVKTISLYLLTGLIVWFCILKSGVHSTIAGVVLALLIPLEKLKELEHRLQTPVSYFIIPLFALANTAIHVSAESFQGLTSSMALGIILGLVIGKPLGIFLATYLSVKQNIGKLPEGVTFKHIAGVGFLAGIGFTMSVFIANLSFSNSETLNMSKLAVLSGSLVAAVMGMLILKQFSAKK